MFRHLLRAALVIAAISVLGAATAGSASASTIAPKLPPAGQMKPLPRMDHSKRPHRLPMQPKTGARTRSDSIVYTENRGCTNWFWWSAIGRYAFHCDTAYYIYGEWQSTDYYYYDWTGSSTAYYGHYRCWKSNVTSDGYVVIGSPSTTQCAWV